MNRQSVSEIIIYQEEGQAVEVRLDTAHDTVWLRQEQMGLLFGRERSVITKHLRNIFKEHELEEGAVCANFAHTADDSKTYQVKHYSLDVIISVGYRVKSQQGTRFRQWATRILREHLTQGWSLSRQRFENNARELEAALALIRKTAQSSELQMDSGRGLVDIVTRYAQTFLLLQCYDEGLLSEPKTQVGGELPSVVEARTELASLKADHLLYFVIKNHPFSDGNKRSAAFLFVDFLNRNAHLLSDNGESVINDIGLAALTLLVAESDPALKEADRRVCFECNEI